MRMEVSLGNYRVTRFWAGVLRKTAKLLSLSLSLKFFELSFNLRAS